MTTEEKAKAYDEALKNAQYWLNAPQVIEDWNYTVKDIIPNIFPELHESEDERIRKAIMEVLKRVSGATDVLENQGTTFKKAMIWLEKQKDLDKMIVVSPEVWDKAIDDAYENGKRDSEKQKEQKPEWSEEEIRTILDDFAECKDTYTSCVNRLKSLRPPQYCENCKLKRPVENWKPSKEQMCYLKKVYESYYFCDGERTALESLYNDLQKLL